jgi:hypothetical protein
LLGIIELLVKGDSLSFVEALESVLHDGGKVDKDVFTSVFGGDEAETLVTEELNLSVARHDKIFLFDVLRIKKLCGIVRMRGGGAYESSEARLMWLLVALPIFGGSQGFLANCKIWIEFGWLAAALVSMRRPFRLRFGG